MVCWNVSWYSETLSSLGGVNVCVMYLIPALKPNCKLVGIWRYLSIRLLATSRDCHPSAIYGVLVLKFGLGEAAALGCMVVVAAARTAVPGKVRGGVTTLGQVEIEAKGVACVDRAELGSFVASAGKGRGVSIP